MTIEKVKGEFTDRQRLKTFFDSLVDGKYQLIADSNFDRTSPQNRYLHGLLIPEFRKALNHCGYNEVRHDDHAKTILKSMFEVTHTSSLTTVEFNRLVEDAIQFAAQYMDYQIPYPNEKI